MDLDEALRAKATTWLAARGRASAERPDALGCLNYSPLTHTPFAFKPVGAMRAPSKPGVE
jgi:hypothetical protein